jgi:hypothetical protein
MMPFDLEAPSRLIFPTLQHPLFKMTPERRAQLEAWQHEQNQLKAAGLLDDYGCVIALNDCPSYIEIGEDTSERCQLLRGHPGAHRVTFEW